MKSIVRRLSPAVVLFALSFLGICGMAVGTPNPPQAQAAEPAEYGWCYYGSYHCYDTAYSKKCYLQRCGYSVKLVDNGHCYVVYYYH